MRERTRPRSLLLREADVWTGRESLPDFAHWCMRQPGQRCALWASAAHLHELMVERDVSLGSDAAAIEWARAQWMQYHGELAGQWALAAWQAGSRRGVSALHGFSLPALLGIARQHQVRLVSVRPWWTLALRDAMGQLPALAQSSTRLVVFEGTHLTRLDLTDGVIDSIQPDRLDAPALRELKRSGSTSLDRPTWAMGYGLAGAPIRRQLLRLA